MLGNDANLRGINASKSDTLHLYILPHCRPKVVDCWEQHRFGQAIAQDLWDYMKYVVFR